MVLRGALSGFGEVAIKAHLAGWQARSDVRIVAIHDPVAERRHHALRLLKNIRVYDDLDLMLDGEALDFLDIASPPAHHASLAGKALLAGVHVLVEKPLCLEAQDYADLSRAAAENSRVLMCVHNWKFSRAYSRAHSLIAAGRLGEPRYISLTRLRSTPAGYGSPAGGDQWRRSARRGGGILIDHGWHAFYLLQWLMDARPIRIAARLEAGVEGIDEAAELRIDFDKSRTAHVHLSWRAPTRRTSALIYGSEGLIEIEGERLVFGARGGETESYAWDTEADDSYHAGWFAVVTDQFVSALAQGNLGALATENAAEVKTALALTLAAKRSDMSAGMPVDVFKTNGG
jgi:predicted dehydrogenase